MSGRGRIVAVCASPGKGTPKDAVRRGELVADHGLAGDAHAGPGDRQISILAHEDIEDFKLRVPDLEPGAFGENLVIGGVDLAALGVGSRLAVGAAELEISRIGKECHHACSIRERAGDCIMPRRGVFAVVRRGGPVAPGDAVTVLHAAPHAEPMDLEDLA
jgi:molybdopterin adenylyltransferase